MFDQVFVAEAVGTKRFWTTCVGVTGQVALVGCMILAPMVWPEALPRVQSWVSIVAPPGPPAPPLATDPAPQARRPAAIRPFVDPSGHVVQPKTIPAKIDMTVDEAPPPSNLYVAGGIPNGSNGGVQNGIMEGILLAGAVAIAPPRLAETPRPIDKPAAAPEPPRIKQGGNVLAGNLISRVEPQYPPLARQMRIQGVVELLAVVGTDGRIRELRLLSGSPLLAPAAMDAVKHWIYRPTYLNGDPVEVMAPITVNFKLN